MATARRMFSYVASLVGLLAVLYAVSGLLALAVALTVPRAGIIVDATDVRARASFFLAALIVGLPLWLSTWITTQRRATRDPDERDAVERRLFLAAVFAISAVVVLFALNDLLAYIFTLPGAADTRPSPLYAIAAAARLPVYGAAWLAYALLGWRERGPRAADAAHDLAVYVVAGFALSVCSLGLAQAVRQLLSIMGRGQSSVLLAADPGWAIWGGIAAFITAGGLVWGLVWRYDVARSGRRTLRVLYLYLVLLVAVPLTLGSAVDGLYELLRRLAGAPGDWVFASNVVPSLLIGSLVWAYHWSVVRRQAALAAAAAQARGAGDGGATGGIAWPRRPAIALLTLLGLAAVVPALISIVWVGLDALLRIGDALSGSGWWRDRLSIGVAAGLVGIVAWLAPWSLLQAAAAAAPLDERAARTRRFLLGGVALLSGLAAVGFTVAMLWLILRTLLGQALDPASAGDALKDLSAAVILLMVATYHGVVLRRDLRLGPSSAGRVRVTALVGPGADEALAHLRREGGAHIAITVMGYLPTSATETRGDLLTPGELAAILTTAQGEVESILLVLHPEGGLLYPYTRATTEAGARRAIGRPQVIEGDEASAPALS